MEKKDVKMVFERVKWANGMRIAAHYTLHTQRKECRIRPLLPARQWKMINSFPSKWKKNFSSRLWFLRSLFPLPLLLRLFMLLPLLYPFSIVCFGCSHQLFIVVFVTVKFIASSVEEKRKNLVEDYFIIFFLLCKLQAYDVQCRR